MGSKPRRQFCSSKVNEYDYGRRTDAIAPQRERQRWQHDDQNKMLPNPREFYNRKVFRIRSQAFMTDLTKNSNGKEVPLDADEIKELEDFQKSWADGQAERDMSALRLERNRLLAATDHLALSDQTLSDEMRSYRQSLRDMPSTEKTPADPTWPIKP
jgi:hypothetical protein